jgi:hypothetical protein
MTASTPRIYWPKPGQGESEIRVVDPALFGKSSWLREKQYFGSYRRIMTIYSGLRFAAVSIRLKGSRAFGRMWYLRPTDSFEAPCPIEAVVPSSIAVNSQSTPYFTVQANNSKRSDQCSR